MSDTKQNADPSGDMMIKDQDSLYVSFLRDSALEARADIRPVLASAEAKKHMDRIKAQQHAQIDAAAH